MIRTKVLLVSGHRVVRDGLRAILASDREMEVVGEAGDMVKALEIARRLMPDVAVIDVAMPDDEELSAVREMANSVRFTRVLVLSSSCCEDYVQRAIEAGAVAYLTSQSAGQDLLEAIREVDSGNAYLCAAAARRLVEHCRESLMKLSQRSAAPTLALDVAPASPVSVRVRVATKSFAMPHVPVRSRSGNSRNSRSVAALAAA